MTKLQAPIKTMDEIVILDRKWSEWGQMNNLFTISKPRNYDMPLFDVAWQADMLGALETWKNCHIMLRVII